MSLTDITFDRESTKTRAGRGSRAFVDKLQGLVIHSQGKYALYRHSEDDQTRYLALDKGTNVVGERAEVEWDAVVAKLLDIALGRTEGNPTFSAPPTDPEEEKRSSWMSLGDLEKLVSAPLDPRPIEESSDEKSISGPDRITLEELYRLNESTRNSFLRTLSPPPSPSTSRPTSRPTSPSLCPRLATLSEMSVAEGAGTIKRPSSPRSPVGFQSMMGAATGIKFSLTRGLSGRRTTKGPE